MIPDDDRPRVPSFAGSAPLFVGAVLLSYAALLAAVTFGLTPAARPAIAAGVCALAAAICRLLHRRSIRQDQGPPAAPAQATSPAGERFRERPAFVVSRGAAMFCGVFSVSSSVGALLLDSRWTAPVAYGATAVVASLVAFAHRRPVSTRGPS